MGTLKRALKASQDEVKTLGSQDAVDVRAVQASSQKELDECLENMVAVLATLNDMQVHAFVNAEGCDLAQLKKLMVDSAKPAFKSTPQGKQIIIAFLKTAKSVQFKPAVGAKGDPFEMSALVNIFQAKVASVEDGRMRVPVLEHIDDPMSQQPFLFTVKDVTCKRIQHVPGVSAHLKWLERQIKKESMTTGMRQLSPTFAKSLLGVLPKEFPNLFTSTWLAVDSMLSEMLFSIKGFSSSSMHSNVG